MEAVGPWQALIELIESCCPKTNKKAGLPPDPLVTMLRIYFLQQWYTLADEAAEDALYEMESMRRFAGLELVDDAIPDATTLLKFRRRLERHGLTERMLETINAVLG